jgi:predicted TIM-barrel fold metal-dependent hydrolase
LQIIDSHFHIYKSAQAGLNAQGGQSIAGYSGTHEETRAILNRRQLSKIIAVAVLPIAPMRQAAIQKQPADLNATQQEEFSADLEMKLQTRLSSYNDWLCRVAREDRRMEPAIAADATLDSKYMADEIQSKIDSYHIKILKIHPTANNLTPDHEGYLKIFEFADKNDLVVISHGGISGDDLEGKYCSPDKFKRILDRFPNLKLVIAHLAYPHIKELLELTSMYKKFYTDISFVLRNSPISDDEFLTIIRQFGPERVLFGSDFPWSDPEKDIERLLKLKLNINELEMVAHQNAMHLFQLT